MHNNVTISRDVTISCLDNYVSQYGVSVHKIMRLGDALKNVLLRSVLNGWFFYEYKLSNLL